MTYFRVVVAGASGSPASSAAVRKAAEIAVGSRAKLIVATARPPTDHPAAAPGLGAVAGRAGDTGWTPSDNVILRRAEVIAKAAGASVVELRVLGGDPVEALAELADSVTADLLVIGSSPTWPYRWCLRSSTSDAIRRRARMQVLIVSPR